MKKFFTLNILPYSGFIVLIGIFLGFSFYAIRDIYVVSHLDRKAICQNITWHKKENWLGKWYLCAEYTFANQKKYYIQKTPLYINEQIANQAAVEKQKGISYVYYSAKKAGISSLDKVFPWKRIFQAGVVGSVLCYFFFLFFYLQNRETKPIDRNH